MFYTLVLWLVTQIIAHSSGICVARLTILNETAIGDYELAKILNDSLTVIIIDIYIIFFLNFCNFLSFSVVFSIRYPLRWL